MPPKRKIEDMTSDDCQQWIQAPEVHPITQKTIELYGEDYDMIEEHCETLGPKHDDTPIVKLLKSRNLQGFKQYVEDPANKVELESPFVYLKNSYIWLALLKLEIWVNSEFRLDALKYIHYHLVGKLGVDNVIALYKRAKTPKSETIVSLLQAEEIYDRYHIFLYSIWPKDELATMQYKGENILLYECKHGSTESIVTLFALKIPFTDETISAAMLLLGFMGKSRAFAFIVKTFYINPNVSHAVDGTPLMYFISNNKSYNFQQAFDEFIDAGASIYASKLVSNITKEETIWDVLNTYPLWINADEEREQVKAAVRRMIANDLQKVLRGDVYISSDAVAMTFSKFIRQSTDPAHCIDCDGMVRLLDQIYMYVGVSEKDIADSINALRHSKKYPNAMFMKPKTYWKSEEVISKLTAKCIKVGQIKQKSKLTPIYEIHLRHKDYNMPVGIIGNYVPQLLPEVQQAAPELLDPLVIEKSLNKIHAKGKLLMKSFPYRANLDIQMFDVIDMDRMKLQNARTTNPVFYQNKGAYLNMIMNIQAVLEKTRYIPSHVFDVVKKPFTSTYSHLINERKQPTDFRNVVGTFTKSLSKSASSKSPKMDIKPILMETLSKLRSPKLKELREKVATKEGPIYDLSEIVTPDESLKPVVNKITKYRTALKSLATKAKTRVKVLEKYYEESMAYIDSLPRAVRSIIYRAVNGQIMQGPYSPIKRMPGGLLYAKAPNAKDVITMVEVTMRAPRFPMSYSLYRGMTLPSVPIPNETVIYQELPFSTTFISNYAIGWILAKKQTPCCLLEVLCHPGTGGLYLSKLPWLDPWTSMNSAIFQRIGPSNATSRFHIKVNSQNEFLMQPYRLKVVGKRKQNFKHMFHDQLEKIDTHYEYDAANRGLVSLQTYNSNILDQEIDVYQVKLDLISLYSITIPEFVYGLFDAPYLYNGRAGIETVNIKTNGYTTLFFSPEELQDTEPDVYTTLMNLIYSHNIPVKKHIEKGKYVGEHTFQLLKNE